jgi:hypothetical protein
METTAAAMRGRNAAATPGMETTAATTGAVAVLLCGRNGCAQNERRPGQQGSDKFGSHAELPLVYVFESRTLIGPESSRV